MACWHNSWLDWFGSAMGSAAMGSDATGSAAADVAGGPSMQISMQFLVQLVKGLFTDSVRSKLGSPTNILLQVVPTKLGSPNFKLCVVQSKLGGPTNTFTISPNKTW